MASDGTLTIQHRSVIRSFGSTLEFGLMKIPKNGGGDLKTDRQKARWYFTVQLELRIRHIINALRVVGGRRGLIEYKISDGCCEGIQGHRSLFFR